MRKKTVAGSGGGGESPPMPEQPDKYEPTEEDIDMVVEEVTGKQVKPANLAAGIALIQRRISQLEAEKIKLLDRTGEDADASLKVHLASLNKNLAIVRERLGFYEGQVGSQN